MEGQIIPELSITESQTAKSPQLPAVLKDLLPAHSKILLGTDLHNPELSAEFSYAAKEFEMNQSVELMKQFEESMRIGSQNSEGAFAQTLLNTILKENKYNVVQIKQRFPEWTILNPGNFATVNYLRVVEDLEQKSPGASSIILEKFAVADLMTYTPQDVPSLLSLVENYKDFDNPLSAFEKDLATELINFGLDPTITFQTWKDSAPNYYAYIGKNSEAIRILEKEKTGIVKTLQTEFGISCFARYNPDTLIEQYKNKDEDIDYGIAVVATADKNGIFYNPTVLSSPLSWVNDRLKELANPRAIRIIEANSKVDALKKIRRLDQKYGKGHKISFAFLVGHGEKEEVRFGKKDPSGKLTVADLEYYRLPYWKEKFFADRLPVVALSCSSGIDNGVMQKVSGITQGVSIGPNKPYMVARIIPSDQNDSLKFKAEYWTDPGFDFKPIEARVYENGKPV